MSGLFSSLQVGREAMQAQQLALEVTKNNVANVNTPGYARQRAQIVESPPVRTGNLVMGRGASVQEIEVYRDRFIEVRLNQEYQQTGFVEGQNSGLTQLQAIFNESSGGGVQDALAAFFGSFLQLASNPASTALRQEVLAKAGHLASTLNSRSRELLTLQMQTDQQVRFSVGEINRLTEQIDKLNTQLLPMEVGGVDGGALRDQRQVLLNRLAEQLDISYYENESGSVMVTTANGQTLVSAGEHKQLEIVTGANSFASVKLGDKDITSDISAGKLGAAIHLRDTVYAQVHNQLDTLANDLLTRVNAQHQAGYDQSAIPQQGGNFFILGNANQAGGHAAGLLRVAISDVKKIAAGLSVNPDDNGNAKAIYALSETTGAGLGDLNFHDYMSGLSSYIAQNTQANEEGLQQQRLLMTQLQRQRESISGVSLDEEAADMIRFQRAFEASSRFFSVINQLTDELLRMME